MSERVYRTGERVLVVVVTTTGRAQRLDPPVPGTVRRRLIRDEGCYVELDRRLADDDCHIFDDHEKRRRYVRTYDAWLLPVAKEPSR